MVLAGALALAACARAAADTYPQGALAFFNLTACPSGWAPAVDANGNPLNGYFLVPFAQPIPPGMLGTTVNPALASGQVRSQTHGFSSSIDLTNVAYAGSTGGRNKDPTSGGTKDFSGTTGAADPRVPNLSLLLCQKTQFQQNTNPPQGVPQYVVTFFLTANCPTGWKPTLSTTGRFLVALPSDAVPGASFGGDPLTVGEDRTHTHAFSGSVTLSSTGVGLASGCCAHDYGGAGTYNFTGTTDAASTGLPYVIVTQCQTCLPGDQDPACAGQ